MTKTIRRHEEFEFKHNGVKMFVDCKASTTWEKEEQTYEYPGSLSYHTQIDKLNKFIVYDSRGKEKIICTGLKSVPREYYDIIVDHIGAIHEED